MAGAVLRIISDKRYMNSACIISFVDELSDAWRATQEIAAQIQSPINISESNRSDVVVDTRHVRDAIKDLETALKGNLAFCPLIFVRT